MSPMPPDRPTLPPPATGTEQRLAFVAMDEAVLPLIAEVDKTAYAHPWNLRHFQDSLAGGHLLQMLVGTPVATSSQTTSAPAPTLPDGRWLLGYFVAMKGVDEAHLLNITTVPRHQRQGWAQVMLQALALWCQQEHCPTLWLEVRDSNAPARALYRKLGFEEVGRRRDYYPAGHGRREDAIVMKQDVAGALHGAAGALGGGQCRP